MEKSDDVMVNLERNHVHYGFAYHSLVKAARTASWNGMKSAWKRDGKTHTPQEITELETAINGFTALLIRPFFLECVPYNVKELRQYMLDGHVPEEELVKLMNPPGASPRFIMRITNFFEYFQSVMTSMHNEWNQRISSAAPEKAASQEFQTFSHALGALDTIFDLYFEE